VLRASIGRIRLLDERASLPRSWAAGTRAACAPKSGPRRCWASDAGKFVSCRRGYCALRSAHECARPRSLHHGPASREEPTLSRLVEAGMDVARLNLRTARMRSRARHRRGPQGGRERRAAGGAPARLQGPKIRVARSRGKGAAGSRAETIITVDPAILAPRSGFPARTKDCPRTCPSETRPDQRRLHPPGGRRRGGKDVRCRVKVGVCSPTTRDQPAGTPVSIPAMTRRHRGPQVRSRARDRLRGDELRAQRRRHPADQEIRAHHAGDRQIGEAAGGRSGRRDRAARGGGDDRPRRSGVEMPSSGCR